MTIPIQLALQGGGAKITYLIAALEAVQTLEREGALRVTRIAGTSAGAITGALYAAGVDMRRARDAFEAERETLLDAFPPIGPLRSLWKLFRRQPFWSPAPLRALLRRLLAHRETLGDLEIPLIVVAADLTNMQPCVYAAPNEPLISSIMDSAGIPFFFRTAPDAAHAGYRVVVDGGICENLPSEELTYAAESGEVVGITFGLSRAASPLTSFAGFARALVETAMRSSVLRAQLELGPNNFVIHTDAGSFDFARALGAGLGAEYRETRLLAERFFRDYAERCSKVEERARSPLTNDPGVSAQFPQRRLRDVTGALRTMYQKQHESVGFEILSLRMIITGASQARPERRGPDDIRHEIVFRASDQPVHCYRIQLTPAAAPDLQKTQCEVFDASSLAIPFDLVPIPDQSGDAREYLLFFRAPIVAGDPRAPVTLRVRDAVAGALRLVADGRDELLTRASRADRPIARVEIVVHLPEELSDTSVAPAFGSEGARMSPSELVTYAAPAGYFTLGWKGENVPPNSMFGCNLVRR
ncbi:MAG TPA: patatin-like phospholipase family protein [Thermoanaerobaculia bacterium]|nr:patatin-like phospholipase family protein [Thermoanaerobaculia bacterium]